MEETEVEINNRHAKFSDAAWYENNPVDVIIGGAGGIGSWLAVLLARINCNLYIFDFDQVDETNMAGQLYKTDHIGVDKTAAVKEVIKEFAGVDEVHEMGRFDDDSLLSPIMFSAFDNMKARKIMYERWCEQEDRELFIDGRMLMEQGMVYFVTPENQDRYKETLFDDNDVEEVPCSAKSTSHSGAHIASIMVAVFTNYLANKKSGMDFREIPFEYTYQFQVMDFQSNR